MVVDDDPALREVLKVNLDGLGYETVTFDEGIAAIDELHNSLYDLVILDVIMPGIDGWEVLKKIRDDPRLDKTRVLILTARDTEKDRLIGKSILKADDFKTKPFDLHSLIDTVKQMLDRER